MPTDPFLSVGHFGAPVWVNIVTREDTDNWGRGRIQLIGDAAHAMLPNAGQGACQAFGVAYALARWLDAGRDDPATALANFRRIRIPHVHGVQQRSFANTRIKHRHDRAARSGRGLEQATRRTRDRVSDRASVTFLSAAAGTHRYRASTCRAAC